jgi:predicted dehydrogenase
MFQPDTYISLDFQARQAKVYRKTEKMKRAEIDPAAIDPRSLENPLAFVFSNLIEVREIKMGKEEPLAEEIVAFVRCVREGRAPEVGAEEGLRAVRVAHQIVQSIAESTERVLRARR